MTTTRPSGFTFLRFLSLFLLLSLLLSTGVALAQTVAYWRFEDVGNLGLDSSGNGFTLTENNSPGFTSTELPAATIPRTGAANVGALDLTAANMETLSSVGSYSPLNDTGFQDYTVEVSFRLTSPANVFGGILSKEGQPLTGTDENRPFTAYYDGANNRARVTVLDGAGGRRRKLRSENGVPIVAPGNPWINLAFVVTGDAASGGTASIYVDRNDGNGYTWEKDTKTITGTGLISSTDIWSIGKGFRDGGAHEAFYMEGQIDEVRISNAALRPHQFLFSNDDNLVEYTLDSSASTMNWTGGTVSGSPIVEQFAGSLSTALQGVLRARLVGNTLTFDDNSTITAVEHTSAGTILPAIAPPEFTGATVLGGEADLTLAGLGIVEIAQRDLVMNIPYGSIDFGDPVSGAMTLRSSNGEFDFFDPSPPNDPISDSFVDNFVLNTSAGNLTRVISGNVETITLPYEMVFNEGAITDMTFSGVIVASRALVDGDYDIDGDVDGFDFLKWQRGESTNPLSTGDLADWETNFGTPSSLSGLSSAVVPEPSSWLLVLSAGFSVMGCVRCRRLTVCQEFCENNFGI